jgi:predicted RNA-binding protein YlxR (DUF448 family)
MPERTCVGCGGRDEKRTLRRLVRSGAGLALDPAQRAPGRGAYLHPRHGCVEAFARRRGGVRSLRWTPPAGERARIAAALADDARSVR